MDYLIGSDAILNSPLQAYSTEACAFLGELSRRLMRHPALRQYPDISALAFWLRGAHLEQMKQECPEREERIGKGLCFHIAPGNVPVNFAFTYAFGLLAGCANIVRLPSKPFGQVEPILECMRELLPQHPEIEMRTAFVRYPVTSDGSEVFSAKADARLIWGGDSTVAALKAMPTKPRCIDIAFADRYSLCVMSGKAITEMDVLSLQRLAEGFYNDTYMMDQNACSSPQLVLWLNDDGKGRQRFWQALHEHAISRYQLEDEVCVNKYVQLCQDAIDCKEVERVIHEDSLLYRAELTAYPKDITTKRGQGGYFYEMAVTNLEGLSNVVTEKFQTLTFFGLSPTLLREFVLSHHLRGIDRIVPVGKAMDIGVFWDGYDLVRMLSRRIALM